jgi:predicted SAM-dependent methyltransferase|tara:strand:+ start:193 stop:804 length:612 start_codon:yes stop_codon:yes gene_type:complete
MKPVKLNVGCASRILPDYINIDLDSLEEIRKRYPNISVPESGEFMVGDVLSLDFDDSSVDEVRADALVEHLSFLEEPKFFNEVKRVLKSGGILRFSVPDFEDAVRKWLEAEDDWKDFFRNDDDAIADKHWFGNYSYSTDNRWGYLMASIFGPQNGVGQFHKNAYTQKKIEAICKALDFEKPKIERFLWKGERDLMLRVEVKKL